MKVLVEVSGRHVHLAKQDADVLFGFNYEPFKIKNLSQTGEFACADKVILRNGAKELSARVIGPMRAHTQVEISASDAAYLGVKPPCNLSGDLSKSAGITLVGRVGELFLTAGVILAKAHIHCDPQNAKKYKFINGQSVKIRCNDYVFEDVVIKISPNFLLAMHIDTDEAVSAGIKKGEVGTGYLID